MYLHTYQSCISDLRVQPSVSDSLAVTLNLSFEISDLLSPANVDITTSASGTGLAAANANIRLLGPDGSRVALKQPSTYQFSGTSGIANFELGEDDVELWYPVGYGKQPLYTVEVDVVDNVRPFFRRFEWRM